MGQLINFQKYKPEQEKHYNRISDPIVKGKAPASIDEGKLKLTHLYKE